MRAPLGSCVGTRLFIQGAACRTVVLVLVEVLLLLLWWIDCERTGLMCASVFSARSLRESLPACAAAERSACGIPAPYPCTHLAVPGTDSSWMEGERERGSEDGALT